jgi:hypothetical protein
MFQRAKEKQSRFKLSFVNVYVSTKRPIQPNGIGRGNFGHGKQFKNDVEQIKRIEIMMTNERKIQIWFLVKDYLKYKKHRQLICNVIGDLVHEKIISLNEYHELTNYITEYLKNNEHVVILQNNNSIVRLLYNISDLDSRINWIDKQIQLLK